MSRTPATYCMRVVRGATWEDEFVYLQPDGTPLSLIGFEARMQVRTIAGQYGTTTNDTLIMELTSNGLDGRLTLVDADGKVKLLVSAADTIVLNPANAKRVKYAYALELYRPAAGADPEYVIPLVRGTISVSGETTR